MLTSWATPSETDAAATPAIIRSFDEATAIAATVLAFLSQTANTLPCRRTGASTPSKIEATRQEGLVISPDGAANQIEGGAIQATSWTLKERVRFDRLNVTSETWETYPILRFSEVPAIDVEFVAANGNPPLGVGECAQGPTAAAIANAVYDALGIRVRSLPLTAEQLIAAMPG
jgi:CO/xanthine dehydrogenase Mo-binding subunit